MGAENTNRIARIPGRVWDLVTGRYVARPLNAIQAELVTMLRDGDVHHAEMMDALRRHADTVAELAAALQIQSETVELVTMLRDGDVHHAEMMDALRRHVDAVAELAAALHIQSETIATTLKEGSKAQTDRLEAIEKSLGGVAETIRNAMADVSQTSRSDTEAIKTAIGGSISHATEAILKAVGEASKASQSDTAGLTGTIEKSLEPLRTELTALSASIAAELENSRITAERDNLESGFISYAPALRRPSTLDTYPPLHKLEDFPDGKLVIFGLQKAGNTWLLALLADTCNLTPYFNIHDPEQYGRRAVISTHDPINLTIRSRRDFVHGVCLMRDIRDMVASYFHYMQTTSYQHEVPRAKYPDIETFYYDWFLSRMVPAYRWHTYWDEYAAAGVPVLRFERLVTDPAGELARLFERWGQPYDAARLRRAVERNTFGALKKKGRTIGATKIEASHFRRGGIGTYVEELPPKIIDDINRRFGDTLRRWGYEVP